MTASILCFDRSEQKRHQDKIDAEDARACRVAELKEELTRTLTVQFLAALGGVGDAVPYVSQGHMGIPDVEREQSIRDAVLEGLDHMTTNDLLMKGLTESKCPIFKELRVALAERYAEENAQELAELRVGRGD